MLRVITGLGQSKPIKCDSGWFPAVTCQGNQKAETNAQGCQRCVQRTASDESSDFCVRSLQFFLAQQGSVPFTAATGKWNAETETALSYRVGPNWRTHAGGACGILTTLQAGELIGGGPFAPQIPGLTPDRPATEAGIFGGIDSTKLAVGALALLAIVALAKRS